MKQFEFLSALHFGLRPKLGIIMGENGLTTARITRTIHLTHDSKKNNRVEVVLLSDQKHYVLNDDDTLKEFINLYRTIYIDGRKMPSIETHIRNWCTNHENVKES